MQRYVNPAIEHIAAAVRLELRRRRISRRKFQQMSEAQRFALTQDALRRYGDVPNR